MLWQWEIEWVDVSRINCCESPSLIHSDERLILKTSAVQIFHSGKSTFINLFLKTKFSYYTLCLSSFLFLIILCTELFLVWPNHRGCPNKSLDKLLHLVKYIRHGHFSHSGVNEDSWVISITLYAFSLLGWQWRFWWSILHATKQ